MAEALRLPADLTHLQARQCLEVLTRALPLAPAVVVDASALERFDSSALAVLLALRRRSQAAGKPFAVQGLSARLGALAAVYGVEALLAPST